MSQPWLGPPLQGELKGFPCFPGQMPPGPCLPGSSAGTWRHSSPNTLGEVRGQSPGGVTGTGVRQLYLAELGRDGSTSWKQVKLVPRAVFLKPSGCSLSALPLLGCSLPGHAPLLYIAGQKQGSSSKQREHLRGTSAHQVWETLAQATGSGSGGMLLWVSTQGLCPPSLLLVMPGQAAAEHLFL